MDDKQTNESLAILRMLADFMLPDWHSQCNSPCVKEMKEYEHRIDELLYSIDNN